MLPDVDWQSFRTCSPKVSCLSYLTHKKIGSGFQNIRVPSVVTLGCQSTTAQSRLKKAVPHLDELRVNLALSVQSVYLQTFEAALFWKKNRPLYRLLVVRTARSCPYCGHCGLSTDHQSRHSQR